MAPTRLALSRTPAAEPDMKAWVSPKDGSTPYRTEEWSYDCSANAFDLNPDPARYPWSSFLDMHYDLACPGAR